MPSPPRSEGNPPAERRLRRLSGLFGRFVAVGLLATGVQYLVLVVLVGLRGVAAVPASAAGFVLSAGANYWLNYRFTFEARGRHRRTIVRFVIVSGVGLLLNSVVMAVMVDGVRVHYLLAQVSASAVVLAWNFIGSLAWTFRSASTVVLLLLLLGAPAPARAEVAPPNTLTVTEMSGATQTDRVVSVARPFRRGEVSSVAQAAVDGVPVQTQNDVKNRWPDGSLKFAMVSFVIPRLPALGRVTVSFSGGSAASGTSDASPEALLESRYDFDAVIEMNGSVVRSVSARRMLAAGHWRYWLRGPIVTAVIIEDRSPQRAYDTDFGDGSRALHPIFEAWFYHGSGTVDVGYTVENTWASSDPARGMRDLAYGLRLLAGRRAQAVRAVQPPFAHIGKSRWHQRHWVGSGPAPVHVDHNLEYLAATRAIPNYDTRVRIPEELIARKYAAWLQTPRSIPGAARGVGSYEKGLSSAGANDWIGLLPTWDTLYLLSMDDRMQRVAIGNANLAGRIPWHFREADTSAGTGRYFDRPLSGTVDTHGRMVSVNARRTVSLWDLSVSSDCGVPFRADRIRTGPVNGEGWTTTRDHMPEPAYLAYLLTGRYYYLEELQYLASFVVAHGTGCYSDIDLEHRQGHNGYLRDSQLRGDAWGFRTLAYAAFLSPDGSPERDYFEDKLRNNVAVWEGEHDVPPSDRSRVEQWTWANQRLRDPRGPSPLGIWRDLGPAAVQPPLLTDGRLKSAGAGWEEHFLLVALGIAREFGYPTDGLLRYMARLRLNLLLNPNANRFLMDAYRWPHKLSSTGNWVQSHGEFTRQFSQAPITWAVEGTADHGYGFIALAATSYLTRYSVDGYDGEAAWALYKSLKPGQGRFATESPKWAILPVPPTTPRR